MPVYCYERADGEIVEFFEALPHPKRVITCKDGVKARRCMAAELRPASARKARLGKWPIFSEAAGVSPNQVAEAKTLFPHHEYTPDGRMIFRDSQHRQKCLREIGMIDKDGNKSK